MRDLVDVLHCAVVFEDIFGCDLHMMDRALACFHRGSILPGVPGSMACDHKRSCWAAMRVVPACGSNTCQRVGVFVTLADFKGSGRSVQLRTRFQQATVIELVPQPLCVVLFRFSKREPGLAKCRDAVGRAERGL